MPDRSKGQASVTASRFGQETVSVPERGSTAEPVRDTPGLSVSDVTVHENHENAASFRVTLDASTSKVVTVRYATQDGSAQEWG